MSDQPGCEPWPLDTTCLTGWDDDPSGWTPEQKRAAELAGEIMNRLTAGFYGICVETVRPCDDSSPCGTVAGGGGEAGPRPVALTWVPDPVDMLSVQILVTGVDTARVDFGDGNPLRTVMGGQTVTYPYAQPGVYTVTATDARDPDRTATVTAGVKDHAPDVALFRSGDDDWHVLAWIREPDDGTEYTVAWGDGTTGHTRTAVPPYPRFGHTYGAVGQYTVTVTDSLTRRTSSTLVDAADLGVLFTFDENAPHDPRITCGWFATGSTWRIDWGDGEITSGVVYAYGWVHATRGAQMPPGDYPVTVTEEIAGAVRRRAKRVLTIPNTWAWNLGTWMSWETGDDPGTQDVTVRADDARSTVRVQWGDGSAPDTFQPGESLTHRYAVPPSLRGYLLEITETGPDLDPPPRWFRRLLVVPEWVGVPVLDASKARTVALPVAGAPDERNMDWYRIRWGDGTSEPLAAIGRRSTPRHVYPQDGTYVIRLDGPGMPGEITRTVRVVSYPSPKVTVAWDATATDPSMSITATVDNTEKAGGVGGPVELAWGDGHRQQVGEAATATHTYRQAGAYTVVVSAMADITAKDRQEIVAPHQTAALSISVRQDQDAAAAVRPWSVLVTLHGDASKHAMLDLGDGDPVEVLIGTGPVAHTYTQDPDPQTYFLGADYVDGSGGADPVDVTVPYPDSASPTPWR